MHKERASNRYTNSSDFERTCSSFHTNNLFLELNERLLLGTVKRLVIVVETGTSFFHQLLASGRPFAQHFCRIAADNRETGKWKQLFDASKERWAHGGMTVSGMITLPGWM